MESYYYVNGEKVPLQRQEGVAAVKFKGVETESAVTRSAVDAKLPGFEAAEEVWPGGEMIMQVSMAETRSAGEQEAVLQELNERPDVEYVSPVFEYAPGDVWIATNQFIAQFKPNLSEYDIKDFNDYYQVEQVERIEWAPRAYLLQVTSRSPGDALVVANAYVESGQVVFAHPNFLRKLAHRAVLQPDPALVNCQWHLSAIQAFEAWQLSTGAPEVTVAIIDDGVDLDHSAFPNKTQFHFNAIDESDNPRPPAPNPKHYAHGTACAGLAVGSTNVEVGTSGVAPGSRLMAVRLLDRVIPPQVKAKVDTVLTGEERLALGRALSVVQPYREARAIQWASEHGADVISNSWGPPDGYGKLGKVYPINDITRLALGYAIEQGRGGKGCVVCWAAGNGNESISADGYACHPKVLAVAACTLEGKRAPYSDYGPEVDVCAPGGGYDEGLLTTVAVDSQGKAYRDDFNGTSAAAPIVAGVAALLLSANPSLTREEVYEILRTTAERIDPDEGQYDGEGHSPFYGFGRVNARRALEEAVRRKEVEKTGLMGQGGKK